MKELQFRRHTRSHLFCVWPVWKPCKATDSRLWVSPLMQQNVRMQLDVSLRDSLAETVPESSHPLHSINISNVAAWQHVWLTFCGHSASSGGYRYCKLSLGQHEEKFLFLLRNRQSFLPSFLHTFFLHSSSFTLLELAESCGSSLIGSSGSNQHLTSERFFYWVRARTPPSTPPQRTMSAKSIY